MAADHTQVRATVSWTGFSGIPIKLNSSTCSKRVGKSEQALKRGCSLCVRHQCVSVCDAAAIRFRKREAIFWKYAGKQTETINFEQLSTRQSISVVTKVSLSFVFCSIPQRQGPERSLQSLEDCLQHNNNFACRKLNTHTWQAQTLRTVKLSCKIYYRTVIL